MGNIFKAARRLPRPPEREAIPEEERADYDQMIERIKTGFGPTTEVVDGDTYGAPHFSALAVSPTVAVAVTKLGFAIMARQDLPDTFTQADHEMIDLVLPLDSGYWAFLAGHTPAAIAGGIRIDAIEALRDGKEHLLTEEEKQQVQFIRAVRDGTMTDDIWERMVARLGTERGVVEFTILICLLIFHHRFCWAVGAPEMTREAFARMLSEFRDGTRPVPPRYKKP